MATFSGREALWSGFRLIRARPGAVMVWAVAYFVLMLLPYAAMIPWLATDFAELAAQSESSDPSASLAQAMALQAKMSLLQAVQMVTAFVAFSVLYGAVFRAVFEPQESRLGYMRFGKQELWLGLVYAIVTVMLIMMMFVLLIPIVVIGVAGALAAGQGQDPSVTTVLLVVACMFAASGLIVWLSARISLAFPMSFAERKFLLFEAWPLTKGHAGKIILVFLAVFAIFLAIELLLLGLIGVVGIVAFMITQPDADTYFQRPAAEWMTELAPAIVLAGIVLSILSAAAYAIFAAPLANIYQQLKAAPATAP